MSRYHREGSPGPQGNGGPHTGGFTPINSQNDWTSRRDRDPPPPRDRNRNRDYDRDYDRDRNRDRDHDRNHDRDRRWDDRDNHYRPHGLPPRPPTGPSGGGDSYRPPISFHIPPRNNQSDTYHPPQTDFNFRFNAPEGVQSEIARFERDGAPAPGPSRPPRTRDARDGRDSRRNQHNTAKFQRKPWRPFVPAQRELLSGAHADAPTESFFNPENGVTYRALDELSDSDEADMDISDGSGSDSDEKEPSHKRTRLGGAESATGQDAPKWSNPDPYTAVPPGGASQVKKKDVVQLIRKARVQTKETKSSIPTEAADFISCDFDDSEDDVTEYQPPAPAPAPDRGQLPSPRTGYGNGIPAIVAQTGQMSGPPGPRTAAYGNAIPSGLPPQSGFTIDLTKPDTIDLTAVPSSPFPRFPVSSLGNHKRGHDDQIKVQYRPTNKKGVPGGDILGEWGRVGLNETATPWFTPQEDLPYGITEILHQEIVAFYDFVRPRQFEERVREHVVRELKRFVRRNWPDYDVYPFGSYPSGLYLPTGDMDMAFLSDKFRDGAAPQFNIKKMQYRLKDALHNAGMSRYPAEVIHMAKVPIIKYVDAKTSLRVDISFENDNGVRAIETFLAWKREYQSMPVLVTLVKQFLAMRGLNEPFNGGIGGFSVICLVVSMYQLQPEFQALCQDTRQNLGKLLLTFFHFYGQVFDYQNMAISLNPPQYIRKSKVVGFGYKNKDRLSIIDPNNPQNDIAGGSSNWATIRDQFSKAYKTLSLRMTWLEHNERSGERSCLGPILGGNYISFQQQRDLLAKVEKRL